MKPFSLPDIIKQRMNKEADFEWSKTTLSANPKYEEIKVIKNKVGWIHFIKETLMSFRP